MNKTPNHIDSPWRRLPFTVTLSLIAWTGIAWGLGMIIDAVLVEDYRPYINMQVVEFANPNAATTPPQATPNPTAETRPPEIPPEKSKDPGPQPTASPTPPNAPELPKSPESMGKPEPPPLDNATDLGQNDNAPISDNATGTLFINLGYPHMDIPN